MRIIVKSIDQWIRRMEQISAATNRVKPDAGIHSPVPRLVHSDRGGCAEALYGPSTQTISVSDEVSTEQGTPAIDTCAADESLGNPAPLIVILSPPSMPEVWGVIFSTVATCESMKDIPS